ncbi:MAG: sigma-70 family RNA polymerase sigma factor [Chthoniobacterales bacterium]|nr:sigma-70 family RNA polymerase sigma factor [Chthoniobacterales bacterium]
MAAQLDDPRKPQEQFASTRWSVVRLAGNDAVSSARALDALSELCQIYWRPLYLFLRREGMGTEEAQDMTQGFFAEMIHDRSYSRADPEKGRFRNFLLGALKHFLADARDFDRALKRGGGQMRVFFDENALAETEAQMATAEKWSATTFYEREWAGALLRQTLERLAQECTDSGKSTFFEEIRPYLGVAGEEAIPYGEISQRLRRGAGTLRSDVARLRTRYRAILREEVRDTVTDASEVDDELRYLCRILAQA